MGGAGEGGEGDGFVLWIQQPVKLRAAGLHAPRQFGLGDFLIHHERIQLPREHALDGAGADLLVDALFFQEVVEGGADTGVCHGEHS